MNCILRDNQGKILGVTLENGKKSKLFDKILSIPFIQDRELALQYYAYTQTNNFPQNAIKDENGEPVLVFKNVNSLTYETSLAKTTGKDKDILFGFLKGEPVKKVVLTLPQAQEEAEFAEELIQMDFKGETIYADKDSNSFIALDKIQINLEPTTVSGFIAHLNNIGVNVTQQIITQEEKAQVPQKVKDLLAWEKSNGLLTPTIEDLGIVGGRRVFEIQYEGKRVGTLKFVDKGDYLSLDKALVYDYYRGMGFAEQALQKAVPFLNKPVQIMFPISPDAMKTSERLLQQGFVEKIDGGYRVVNDTRFMVIGEQGANQVQKEKQLLDRAKELQSQGVNLQEIENQTGWFFMDDQWKKLSPELIETFKIKPDASNKTNVEQTLEEVLADPLLFEYYPNVKNVKVVFYTNEYLDTKGKTQAFQATDTKGFLSPLEGESGVVYINSSQNETNRASTLAHEITHLLGDIERFPAIKGGLPIIRNAFNMVQNNDNVINQNNFLIIGEQGAEQLDKIQEVTTRLDNLQVARDMEFSLDLDIDYWQEKNKNIEEKTKILLATGWQRGVDGFWRYEVADNTLDDFEKGLEKDALYGEETFVTDFFSKNDDIIKSYPQLKDIKVVIDRKKSDSKGSYSEKNKRITLYAKSFTNPFNKDKGMANFQSTLLHEVQHVIQDIEGFARGSSTEISLDDVERFKKIAKKKYGENSDTYRKIAESLDENEEGITAYEAYKRVAGEIESRNVQQRMNMSAEQRRQTLLQETEDVAREDQIIILDAFDNNRISRLQLKTTTPQQKEKARKLTKYLTDSLGYDISILTSEQMQEEVERRGFTNLQAMIRAYHGSPYAFDRFEFSDRTFLTGEKAAAFGAGLYMTSLEDIGRQYAEKLSDLSVDGVSFSSVLENTKEPLWNTNKVLKVYDILKQKALDNNTPITDFKTLKEFIESDYLYNWANGVFGRTKLNKEIGSVDGFFNFTNDIFRIAKENKKKLKTSRNLYTVTLFKDKTPDQYTLLEWDKKIPKELEDKLTKAIWESQELTGREKETLTPLSSFDSGSGLYKAMATYLGGQRQASQFLLSFGIDGIKYPAESIARGATSETARGFNYVIFDENAITIESRIQFLENKGQVYGFYDTTQDKIYLNESNLQPNSLIHELYHAFKPSLKRKALEGDTKAQTMLKAMDKIVDESGLYNEKEIEEVYSKQQTVNTQDTRFMVLPNGEQAQVRTVNADVVNGFYSPLEKTINETKFDKLPAKQWLEKHSQFRGEEAKWTGLQDWLSQQQGSVSKADIQNYLKENRIEIVEVVKGEDYIGKEKEYKDKAISVGKNFGFNVDFGSENEILLPYSKYDIETKSDREFVSNNDDISINALEAMVELYKENSKYAYKPNAFYNEIGDVKYRQYQLEGEKENYKEILITLPYKMDIVREYNFKLADYNNFVKSLDKPTPEERQKADIMKSELNALQSKLPKEVSYQQGFAYLNDGFKSSHYSEENIITHLRMNTRTDVEGNKVLFLEEVQSDWGQQGKKEGFKPSNYEELRKEANEISRSYLEKFGSVNGMATHEFYKALGQDSRYKEINEILNKVNIPTAPFVTDTNTWTKLGLKVALKEAVKQGTNKIAWSTGTQQFDRWGSEEISWRKNPTRTSQEEARMKELGEKIVNYKDTEEERVEHEKLARKEGGYSLLINEQTSGATAFNGQESGNKDYVNIQSKEDLRKAIKKNLSRERNEAEIDKLTDRIWKRMQTEDSGTSLPRKEGMEGFYGVPSENKLGIVGNVAKSLFKQEPNMVEIEVGRKKSAPIESITLNGESVKEKSPWASYILDYNKTGKSYTIDENKLSEILTFHKKQIDNAVYKLREVEGLINSLSIGDKVVIESTAKTPTSTQHSIDITPELKATVESGLPLFMAQNSQAYAPRPNETLSQYKDRMREEVEATLLGENADQYLDQAQAKSILEKIENWIKEFTEWITRQLGFENVTEQQLQDMTMKDILDRVTTEMLRTPAENAQEYFQREADRLPLTLSVFQRPEFVKMQGKQVNPITVLNSLNQSGIKQIEKDLIKNIIEENYQGQKKISYDELEATVRANIMPLERIFTSSYADYGMNNLGNGNYGEANTIILNAPIEHGVTGHFSGDFKASGRKNIKYVPKQLNDNTWVAVEEGYETQANNNNIYQFVGTAGTKEAVEGWIENYEKPLDKSIKINSGVSYREIEDGQIKFGVVKQINGNLYTIQNNDSKVNITIPQNLLYNTTGFNYSEDINKGMFGHIRVWQDGQNFYVAELQSDYFQKNNAKKEVEPSTPEYDAEKIKLKEKYQAFSRENFKKIGINILTDNPNLLYLTTPLKIRRAVESKTISLDKNSEIQKLLDNIDEGFKSDNIEIRRQIDEDVKRVVEIVKVNTNIEFNKDYNKELNDLKNKYLSLQEKQFIASQKEWEKRMVREAIKEASLSGATSLRFPTPYTLSVIESYVKGNILTSTEKGAIVRYLGEDYIILDDNEPSAIELIPIRNMQRVKVSDFEKLMEKGEVDDYTDIHTYYLGDIGVGVIDVAEEYFYYNTSYKPEGIEVISTIRKKSILKENFDIESMLDRDENGNEVEIYNEKTGKKEIDRTQRTVAYKYLEIAETLKQERGDNFEVITDENGFDWYETKIDNTESQRPIVAFMVGETEVLETRIASSKDFQIKSLMDKGEITRSCKL